ncbi:MAG: SCO family protein [Flavobacteriales bacterium]|nr:SCO family protein [Flavobacteriales bacterium]
MSSNKKIKKYIVLTGVLFLFPIALLLLFAKGSKHKFNTLPYLDEQGVHEIALGASINWDTIHGLPDFRLTNHLGNTFTRDSLDGKIWLVAFFATDGEFVLDATKQLLWPNYRYREEKDIGILCLTLNPTHDTPQVLNEYVTQNIKYNIATDKWQFLTGDEGDIRSLMSDGFIQRDTSDNIATFYLVDFDKHIRGRYNASLPDAMKDVVEDIALLKKEHDIKAAAARNANGH